MDIPNKQDVTSRLLAMGLTDFDIKAHYNGEFYCDWCKDYCDTATLATVEHAEIKGHGVCAFCLAKEDSK